MIAWMGDWDDIAALVRSDPQLAQWARTYNNGEGLYMALLNRSYQRPGEARLKLPSYAQGRPRVYALAYELAQHMFHAQDITVPCVVEHSRDPPEDYLRMFGPPGVRYFAAYVRAKPLEFSPEHYGGLIFSARAVARYRNLRGPAHTVRITSVEQFTELLFLLWHSSLKMRWRIPRRNIGEPVCSACQAVAPVLYPCSGCNSVVYCGTECQAYDWQRHGIQCLM
jgi:hypothetical protein